MTQALFCPEKLKLEFPLLQNHPELVYLDTAATAQKPAVVIDAMSDFLKSDYATVHRAAYRLSYQATDLFEKARHTVASFIHADSEHLIFTKGTTEALNFLSFGMRAFIQPSSEILVLETEHHANLLPWQELAKFSSAKLVKVPVLDSGVVDLDALKGLITPRSRVLAVAHMSNVTGALQPLEELARLIHSVGGYLIVDGAQGVVHESIDVKKIPVDAYAFSSHKLYGPTGIGAVYVHPSLLKKLGLYQVGGDVIETVSFEQTLYKEGRARFEAGTPMIVEAIGFAAAIDFLKRQNLGEAKAYEKRLGALMQSQLRQMSGIHVIGESECGLITFYSDAVHALDLATYLDSRHIAIRSGHMCAQTALARFHVKQAARISCGLYTSFEEVEKALKAIEEALCFFN